MLLKLLSLGSVSEEKILQPFPSTGSSVSKATEWRQSYPWLVTQERMEGREINKLSSYLVLSDVGGLLGRSFSGGSPLPSLQKTGFLLWETTNSNTHKRKPLWIWSPPATCNLSSELTEWHWSHRSLLEVQDKAGGGTVSLSVTVLLHSNLFS